MKNILVLLFLGSVMSATGTQAQTSDGTPELIAAMLGDTPLEQDLTYLSQFIGGRETGTAANLRAVEWALQRFHDADATARKEAFSMPTRWHERHASATLTGDGVSFDAAIAAMPFSMATPKAGLSANLISAGRGSADDFAALGKNARGTWLLVETELLTDINGLFREYTDAYHIERHALEVAAAGWIYMSSRAPGVLYRHNASLRGDDSMPAVIMERGAASAGRVAHGNTTPGNVIGGT